MWDEISLLERDVPCTLSVRETERWRYYVVDITITT